jgi:hypothetical protein
MQIKGTFDAKMTAEPPFSEIDGVSISRATVEKTFHGELDATSTVHMTAVRNSAVAASAGYVAIERVIGKLAGRAGTFVLQHNGIMNRGTGTLECTVVPDSGTGELVGLSGRVTIEIVDKQHHYAFDYELAST